MNDPMTTVGRTIHLALGSWLAVAAFQNAAAVLATSGLAPQLKPLASKNVALVGKVAEPLHLSPRAIAALVTCASVIEAAAAAALVRATLTGKRSELGFGLSLALFSGFFVIDDMLDDYDLGAKHRAIFTLFAVAYAACGSARS